MNDERCYCYTCKEITPHSVTRTAEKWLWHCKTCGHCNDDEFIDDDPYGYDEPQGDPTP